MVNIGVDLGGTKIEVVALAPDTGCVLERERVATPQGNYAATLAAVAQLVDQIESSLGKRGTVGIGLPGSPSPGSRLMRNANSTCLNDQPLQQDIERLLDRSVAIANDANCFTLSEATDGAAAGARSVFGVIIGTGTGAGVIVNGQLHEGANGVAGEWGHNPLPWPAQDEYPGPGCWCGLRGCIETWLSGPALQRDHRVHTNQVASASQIAVDAAAGDRAALATLERYALRMAKALAHVINILDPDVIVLGGGLSNIEFLYRRVPELWAEYIFSDCVLTQLRAPRFGDASGVRGAAWLGANNAAQ